MKVTTYFAVLFCTCLIIVGCNDRFSPVGSDFLTDTIGVFTVSTDSAALFKKTTTYHRKISTTTLFNNGVLYIGKSGDIEAFSLIRMINIPDTLSQLNASDIVSATLKLEPLRYTFGDSIANMLQFSVVKVNKLWRPTATLDTITQEYFDSKQLASFSGTIPLKDSVAAIAMDFDKDILVDWFKLRKLSGNDSAIYGIALRPQSGSTLIRSFSTGLVGNTQRKSSTIEVVYRRDNSALDTVILRSGYDASFLSAPIPQTDDIVLQGGLPLVTELVCDFSSLPPNVAIQRADLVLTFDPSRSLFGNKGTDSILTATYVDSTRNNLLGTTFGIRTKGTNTFTYPLVSGFVEAGYRGKNKAGTLLLQVYDRIARTDRYMFYGINHPDKSKRPKMTIIYSTRP
ncbi:MAG TPA: hypothetical protein PLW09_07835 [Candidatus Kapabacteria bacterium]|jgi:hypothetical protein|nr:hypothetical protein [Ignavibacteria bacterium]HRE57719.1 hypothetical protein [Candidatus Kapabacteria bacterium]HRK58290.1 hypothetical protein [Candidatus Kapabacteria bacterium]